MATVVDKEKKSQKKEKKELEAQEKIRRKEAKKKKKELEESQLAGQAHTFEVPANFVPPPLKKVGSVVGGDTDDLENNYTVKEVLGEGNYAVVRRGIHNASGEDRALKFMNKARFIKDSRKLRTEVEIMKKVNHPNVVRLYEVYESKSQVILVLELVQGGELFDRIVDQHHYSEQVALKVVKQIIIAVQYLHSMGIVHRDLKPENLLLSSKHSDAEIKIADFGLAKLFDEDSMGGSQGGLVMQTACGTPGYIAPEILMAEGTGYDNAVDVWSIGVITYILLCGFPPFYSEDDNELFRLTLEGKVNFPRPYWDKVTPVAKDFILHLLQKSPEKRYTIEQCLKHPWLNQKGDSNAKEPLPNVPQNLKERKNTLKKVKNKIQHMFHHNPEEFEE